MAVEYTYTYVSEIREAWKDLAETLPKRKEVNKIFRKIIRAYSGRGRHYHGLGHLVHGLKELKDFRSLSLEAKLIDENRWTAILFAWFLHDIVIRKQDINPECASANIAWDTARRMKLDQWFLDLVNNSILATNHSQPAPGTRRPLEYQVLLDVDLAIFGQSPEVYDRYSRQIRRENILTPRKKFAARRIKLLEKFLERQYIYQTSFFRLQYEETARQNLSRELEVLRAMIG